MMPTAVGYFILNRRSKPIGLLTKQTVHIFRLFNAVDFK